MRSVQNLPNTAENRLKPKKKSGIGDSESEEESVTYNVIMSNLPNSATEDLLMGWLGKQGPVESLKVWSRGNFENCTYALLSTKSKQFKNKLLSNVQIFHNTEFFCRHYFSKDEKELYLQDLKQRRLFFKNVPKGLPDNKLLKLFRSRFYTEKAYQIRKFNSSGQGYGYVIFAKPEES